MHFSAAALIPQPCMKMGFGRIEVFFGLEFAGHVHCCMHGAEFGGLFLDFGGRNTVYPIFRLGEGVDWSTYIIGLEIDALWN